MIDNKLKVKLSNENELTVLAQMSADADIAEMIGLAGFDGILLDCQHGDLSVGEVKNVIRAAECGGAAVIVRTWKNDPDLVIRYLDCGAAGILFPDIQTPEDAIAAVNSVKYPPLGKRGLSGSRASGFGFKGSLTDFVEKANEETIVALMIESKKGIENLEEITKVPGVDLLCLGTSDLSNDLGHPGDLKNPEFIEWEERAYAVSAACGVPMDSIFRPGIMDIKEEMAKGRRVMTLSISSMISAGLKDYIAGTKGK